MKGAAAIKMTQKMPRAQEARCKSVRLQLSTDAAAKSLPTSFPGNIRSGQQIFTWGCDSWHPCPC